MASVSKDQLYTQNLQVRRGLGGLEKPVAVGYLVPVKSKENLEHEQPVHEAYGLPKHTPWSGTRRAYRARQVTARDITSEDKCISSTMASRVPRGRVTRDAVPEDGGWKTSGGCREAESQPPLVVDS